MVTTPATAPIAASGQLAIALIRVSRAGQRLDHRRLGMADQGHVQAAAEVVRAALRAVDRLVDGDQVDFLPAHPSIPTNGCGPAAVGILAELHGAYAAVQRAAEILSLHPDTADHDRTRAAIGPHLSAVAAALDPLTDVDLPATSGSAVPHLDPAPGTATRTSDSPGRPTYR